MLFVRSIIRLQSDGLVCQERVMPSDYACTWGKYKILVFASNSCWFNLKYSRIRKSGTLSDLRAELVTISWPLPNTHLRKSRMFCSMRQFKTEYRGTLSCEILLYRHYTTTEKRYVSTPRTFITYSQDSLWWLRQDDSRVRNYLQQLCLRTPYVHYFIKSLGAKQQSVLRFHVGAKVDGA